MNGIQTKQSLFKGTLGDKLGILFITFFVMLVALSLLSGLYAGFFDSERDAFLLTSALQSVLCFILPAWLTALLCTVKPYRYLGVDVKVRGSQFLFAFLVLLLITPAMNALVDWNEGVHLPESMAALEQSLRAMEDTAAGATEMLLGDSSVWGLVSGVLVIGVITGIGEEAFFRAGLQKALCGSKMNHHAAIWIAAFLFSAIHFQFFGFWPRLLLGAMFGYFYYYSGSLWVPAFAHALNNSTVVVTSWLVSRGYISEGIENFGLGSGWLVAGSILLTAAFVFLFGKMWLARRDNTDERRGAKPVAG